MTNSKKLSLISAILININIMIGSGIFINTVILTKIAGSLSPISYLIAGILLLPIVISIVKLWALSESETNFYQMGSIISPFIGFLSSWAYFIGKISSFTLGIHVCNSILAQIFPILEFIPLLLLDLSLIIIITLLNLLNLKTNSKIQYGFIIFKFIPILFMIFSSFYLFSKSNFKPNLLILSGIPPSITLVFYAFSGFEASCSLSRLIENPKKNGVKAIIISYLITVFIATLYQFSFCSIFSEIINQLPNGYLSIFKSLIYKLTNNKYYIAYILNLGIAISSIGSAYGIIFSNSWNLYNLAKNNHIFFSNIITKLNKENVPYICIIAESIIAILYLFISNAQQIALQQVGVFAITITYTLSVIAFLFLSVRQKNKINTKIAFIAILSCLILISTFLYNVIFYKASYLLFLFIVIIFFGSYMFYKKHMIK